MTFFKCVCHKYGPAISIFNYIEYIIGVEGLQARITCDELERSYQLC